MGSDLTDQMPPSPDGPDGIKGPPMSSGPHHPPTYDIGFTFLKWIFKMPP